MSTLTENGASPRTSAAAVEDRLPRLSTLPDIKIYSHSTLFYWWPAWFFGYILAGVSYFSGGTIELDKFRQEWFYPSAGAGVSYVALLLFLVTFTNLRMRGLYSVLFVISMAFIVVLLAWLGWWDDIAEVVPHLSVHMNMGFYLVFSTGLLIIWLLAFFIFDRLVFWRIRPGQMTEEHLIGGAEQSYDARGMLFEQQGDDFLRHVVLGLGAGDLKLTTSGAKKTTIDIPNVLFANRKIRRIQKLIHVSPDDILRSDDR